MKPSIYYPVKPFHVNQHFGDNFPCVKDFGLSDQTIVNGGVGSCPIGYNKLYQHFGMSGHNGTDLLAGEQPVYAAMAGTVVEQQTVPARGLGLGILTDEQYDLGELGIHFLKLRYWHLKDFKVGVGDRVEIGKIIGTSDSTGYSSGDHLHFECQPMNKDSGGHPYVALPDKDTTVIAGAINLEPYLNGLYACDNALTASDQIAILAAKFVAQGKDSQAKILSALSTLLRSFGY